MTVAARVSDNVWDARVDTLVNCVRPVIAWARCERALPIGDNPVPASGVEQPEQALAQHSYVLMRVPSVLSASSP
jgi:hypothetical protein